MGRSENILGALALSIADRLRAAETDADILPVPATALVHLSHCRCPSIASLSNVLGLSHSATVRVADRLERDGFATRNAAEWDSRAVALKLTAKGQDAVESYLQARREVLEPLLSTDIEVEELRSFMRVAERILAKLTNGRAELYRNCRLCDFSVCHDCPVAGALA